MRTVAEHLAACLDIAQAAPPLDVALPDAVGCVLAQDVVASIDMPSVDCANVDGYAVRGADLEGACPDRPVILDVIDAVRAGDVRTTSLIPGSAVLIDSGAPLPIGADTVVPWQHTDRGQAKVRISEVVPVGQEVRPRGHDVKQGETVLAQGSRVGARQVALIAAVGLNRVSVHPAPRVVIVSIGDELIEPGSQREPGSVFDANGHALATAVSDAGGRAFRVAAVPDEHQALTQTLEDQLVRADVIITTGGLSVGQGDTVKDVLTPLGTVRFDSVSMWPGRQLGVGTIDEETPVFCLPGDPVAAQIAFETFVRPVLRQIAGWSDLHRPSIPASVTKGWHSPLGKREFVPVHVTGSPTKGYRAEPCSESGVTRVSALAKANAIAVVPEDVVTVVSGDRLHCLLLDA
ncbi:gephyrin-like molybdotransferase Glp [Actinomyces vulturis]|uniref:molybdopterin molybdotransferase MoeA n=1 Tax=Actinomyces vulturis TaxID=1857645 RepID=UPI00082E8F09|nr:gephyrin-like molybdotransferase Glp [Actinomyces vulturis]